LLVALPDTGLPAVADELSRLYDVDSEYWEIDLSDRESVTTFVQSVRDSHRTVELLVNNAGIGGTTPFATQRPERQTAMIDVNVGALTLLTRLMLPHLLGNERAYILNVASLAGWYPSPGMAVYAATKAYVISFSLALQNELADTCVSVSVLCPSGVVTKEAVVKALSDQGCWGRATSRYPDQLARFAITRAYRRQRILVPGLMNRMLRIAGRLTPLRMLTKVVGSRFTDSRRDHAAGAGDPGPAAIGVPEHARPA
jgi:short-subunit dehydrogenase